MAKRVKNLPTILPKGKRLKNAKGRPTYRPPKNFDLHLSEEQRAESKKLFTMVKDILLHVTHDIDVNTKLILLTAINVLGAIEFDIDAGSRKLEDAVHKSGIRGGIQKYLKFLS